MAISIVLLKSILKVWFVSSGLDCTCTSNLQYCLILILQGVSGVTHLGQLQLVQWRLRRRQRRESQQQQVRGKMREFSISLE
jgi:hypothetical protein